MSVDPSRDEAPDSSSPPSQISAVLRWAPYTWIALPIVGLLAFSRYGGPSGLAGWMPYVALALALLAVERGCALLFSLAAGKRPAAPRDLGSQLALAGGFCIVLWSFREYMNQALQ